MVLPDGAGGYAGRRSSTSCIGRRWAILTRPDVRERLEEIGMEAIGNTPGEFAAVIAAETPQWAKVIRDAGIKASE